MNTKQEDNQTITEEVIADIEKILFYASSTGGFYLSTMHTDIPVDAVEITSELHQELLDGQSNGKIIMPPDKDHDLPWLADSPPPPAPARADIIRAELIALDAEYLTTRTLAGLAAGDEIALKRWQEHEAKAEELRAELAELQGNKNDN